MEGSVSCLVDGLAVSSVFVTMSILDTVIFMLDLETITVMSSAMLIASCLMMYYLVNKNLFADLGIFFLGMFIQLYSSIVQLKRMWKKPCAVKTRTQGM